jgi:hypothetical protein
MRTFVVCLCAWDYRCDKDFVENVLAVYDTLEKAVSYSCSYEKLGHKDIEIVEFEECQKICTHSKNGEKILYDDADTL